ncbi:MAG: phosphoenolpyruvate carboxykinase (ATP) [Candidatus Wallbacteria bacterium]|nr:phosphoenolpyruvate carboxykinase (ATP) [Candidatus Wallbacteria bacterium]
MIFSEKLKRMLNGANLNRNPDRKQMIREAVLNLEAVKSANGALATWTPPESTGRSPKDTYIVKRPSYEHEIDWTSANNIPLSPDAFAQLFDDAVRTLSGKEKLYLTERSLGADSSYSLPVVTISSLALTSLFTDNMFRPAQDAGKSVFAGTPFHILVVPKDKLDSTQYTGKLRKLADGRASDLAIAVDFENMLGIIYGSSYCGSVKKLMFTVMNYLLPKHGILPLHCSANVSKDGNNVALFLGLSGTGKTTLSADPELLLIGDDEHGWNDTGIANFEWGCYAKLINLNPKKEPEIFNACFHKASYLRHGAIIENALLYPDGRFDLNDSRLTENSRGSYPLTFLKNIEPSSRAGHPQNIIFLAADANGVLPPVARLTRERAMLWFLLGYTSKLAGTETGVTEPTTTFSRFFGGPFMPRNPGDYMKLLGEKMDKYQTDVYLVNTGWSGGPYGIGKRMDINLTRSIIRAILKGEMRNCSFLEDRLFHLAVPTACPGVPAEVLSPRNTWKEPAAYEERARKLALEFSENFDKAYGRSGILPNIVAQCPGK